MVRKKIKNETQFRNSYMTHKNKTKGLSLLIIVMLLISHTNSNSYAQPLASGKSKFVGNIIANGYSIRSDFSKYWNQVTPENATKWASVEGTAGNYNWGQVDNIYNYALTNKIPFK
ncbi:MAG: endo-1,4-beta-xylanase, partial [Ignavibacteria bacterium]|nr:endo-1,4-beta-xylanase [Ignavibacteria bacterium]